MGQQEIQSRAHSKGSHYLLGVMCPGWGRGLTTLSSITGGAMASSNKRERRLAREKHERQEARRTHEDKKADRTKIVAWVVIISLVLLTTSGFLLNWLVF